MSPEAVRHLDRLGVLAALDGAGGTPLAGTTVIGPRGSRLTGLFARAGTAPWRPTGLSLPRYLVDNHLVAAARAAGATVLEGHAVEDLLFTRGSIAGAMVRRPDGSHLPLRARLTIGADGLHSVVARRLGVRRQGWPRRMAFVAHVADVPGLEDRAEMHVGAEGYVGLNPLGHGLVNVALVVPESLVLAARGRAEAFFLDRLATFPGVRGRVRREAIRRRVLVTGPFAAWSRRGTGNGVLLTGDTADFFDPFTGEGICTALRGGGMAGAGARGPWPIRGQERRSGWGP